MVFHPDEVALCRAHVKADSASDTKKQKKERNNRLMEALEEVALKLHQSVKPWVSVKRQLALLRKNPQQMEVYREKCRDKNVETNAKTSLKLRQESAEWIAAQAAQGLMRSAPEVHFFNAVLYVTCCC